MTEKEQPVCAYHPNKKGTHKCGKCGKKICFDCVCVSFGNYVCEECDIDPEIDLKQAKPPSASAPPPPDQKTIKTMLPDFFPSFLRNSKYSKWIVAASLALFLGVFTFSMVILNMPAEKLSIYRVSYYPLKSEGKAFTRSLKEKGISADWKSIENKLTEDRGYFVYFDNPETAGFKPVWYVLNEVAFTINEDSRTLCNSEIPETTIFSEKGLTEDDILSHIYGKVR